MHFRVTSITGSEEAERIRRVTVPLERRLNQDLAAVDFGSDLTRFVLLFVTAFDETETNERWARANTKLGRARTDENGHVARTQFMGVPVARSGTTTLAGDDLAAYLAAAAASAFSQRPSRCARGLAWKALGHEILARLSPTVPMTIRPAADRDQGRRPPDER